MQECGCIYTFAGMHKHIYKHIHVHKNVSLAHVYRLEGKRNLVDQTEFTWSWQNREALSVYVYVYFCMHTQPGSVSFCRRKSCPLFKINTVSIKHS